MDKLTKAEKKEIRKQERHEWEKQMEKEQQMKKFKKLGLWLGGIIALGLIVWGLIAMVSSPTPASSNQPTLTAPKITDLDITYGPKDAKVTLIEYADFQCPSCGFYHPWVKQLMHDFNGKVLFVYRYFPLTTIHQNAMVSAEAGQAANLQGKFWEMNDMLFEHQQDWSNATDPESIFTSYAQKIGLDVAKFKQDMASDATKKFINDEADGGTNAGVNGTPTFFLNGQSIPLQQSYDSFKSLIQQKLNGK